MFIEVKDNTVEMKSGVSQKSGKGYEIFEQTALFHRGDERIRVTLGLRKGQTPYAAGRYVISAESFVVDNFGSLKIGRLQLIPANDPAKKVA